MPPNPPARPAAAPRPLRLLQVLGYAGEAGRQAGITGVEKVVQLLVQGLPEPRFEHYLAYPRAGLLFDALAARARDVLPLEPSRRFDRAYVGRLQEFMHRHAVDVVVSHGLRFDFLTALACRHTRLPHVVVRAVALADEPMGRMRKLAYGLVDAWTLRSCRGVIAVSEASRRRMLRTQRLEPAKVDVIPNGVQLPVVSPAQRRAARRALGLDDDALVVGGVGQLIARKSFATLVDALGPLTSRHPRLAGVVLGEGPERADLEQRARRLGVRLLLPGYLPDPYPTVAAFDVAVLPSRAEGMPLVVLESMALGVPTVATPAAGTTELIESETSGLLVPVGNATALAACIDRLLADPELRQRLAAAGAARVRERFALESMLRRFDTYLSRVAAGGEAR
jgi:glycosyltransferase involved in cell wall biosynthesis